LFGSFGSWLVKKLAPAPGEEADAKDAATLLTLEEVDRAENAATLPTLVELNPAEEADAEDAATLLTLEEVDRAEDATPVDTGYGGFLVATPDMPSPWVCEKDGHLVATLDGPKVDAKEVSFDPSDELDPSLVHDASDAVRWDGFLGVVHVPLGDSQWAWAASPSPLGVLQISHRRTVKTQRLSYVHAAHRHTDTEAATSARSWLRPGAAPPTWTVLFPK
jgi:hypothetical protein